jgi:hypothetical protein
MNKNPAHCTGTRIEIFITAPAGKVNIPIVQMQRNIAGGMCQVKPAFYPGSMSSFGNFFYIKKLARVIIDTTE